jgi:two-component system nitrogen regulation sensor histidine kinase NtrY
MSENQSNNSKLEQRRRSRELFVIIALVVIIVMLTYIESHISIISGDIPIATNILVLGLINLNIVLLIVLVFLILRNAVKLFFESKRKVMGSRLKTKLVAAIVGLTIIPTFLLFFTVIVLINKSIDAWFDIRIEDALEESLVLAQNYYKDMGDNMQSTSWRIAEQVATLKLLKDGDALTEFIDAKIHESDLSTVEVYDVTGRRVAYGISPKINRNMVPDISEALVAKAFGDGAGSFVETFNVGDVVRGVALVPPHDLSGVDIGGAPPGVVVVSFHISGSIVSKMKAITTSFESYKQLKILKNPVKATYFSILLIITLMIVFFALWIGQAIAKAITVPIFELAEGTHAVASGNLDYTIDVESSDEIGLLVKSFNRMTKDLKSGKTRIEEANLELREINSELDGRRRYIEIVLGNIPAGVVAIDRSGRITSINKVAADIFGIPEQRAMGRNYKEVLKPAERDLLRDMIREMSELSAENLEKQMKVELEGRVITVLVNLTALRDESGEYIGMVAVLDDLTHLLKTQRMSAWKEVARRIAHEIKNPLTPIQLSAERLRKKYLDKLSGKADVFDECTATIINQVDELKTLVNEFSSFARMPSANLTVNDLNAIVEEVVAFYKPGHKDIIFDVGLDKNLPPLELDRDQIKRALINLVDNSIAALHAEGKEALELWRVSISTRYDRELKIARLQVSDTGMGIPPEDKGRLFEPYFSTKHTGTGLGLAIVNNIVADHNGYIRVRDNEPRGTRFIIELPVKALA